MLFTMQFYFLVYNWTLDDTIDWLTNHVELPQYVDTFKSNAVTGHSLPRSGILQCAQ